VTWFRTAACVRPVADIHQLSGLPEPAPMTLLYPGSDEWERKVRLAPRTLSVVTGPRPRSGTRSGSMWSSATRSTSPTRSARRPMPGSTIFFLVHQTNRPTLKWFGGCDLRHGVRIVHVDPCNRLEASRGPGERDDGYVLRTLYQFATDMNCHVVLAPAKMEGARRGHAPTLEDSAGAKHWDNVVDEGLRWIDRGYTRRVRSRPRPVFSSKGRDLMSWVILVNCP
jgi:twinkle protein